MLDFDYDYDKQLKVLKHILRYLTIYNKLFSPREKLTSSDLRQSMMGWLPRTQNPTMMNYIKEFTELMVEYNLPRSVSYHNLIIREIDNWTSLKADEETK